MIHPKVIPESETIMSIEEIISSNSEAREFYSSEFDTFEVNPGPMGDPEGSMERLRVTPGKHSLQDVIGEVEKQQVDSFS